MEIEFMMSDEGGKAYGEKPSGETPTIFNDSVSVVSICIAPEHLKKIKALAPGSKMSVAFRGTVQSFEQKMQEGYGAPVGELCVHATEISFSKGSEYDELLEED